MTGDDGLAALLAEHRDILAVHCACLWKPSSFKLTIEQFRKEHEAHVAAVVRAAGWAKGREEIAVRDNTGTIWAITGGIADARRAIADTFPGTHAVVRRYVTDWEPVE